MSQSICVICDKPFEQVKKHLSQTCSSECAKKWRAQRVAESYAASGSWVEATCTNRECGKPFRHRRSKPQKFCSKTCYNQMTHEAAVEARRCVECGNPMTSFKRQDQQFCSPTCRNRHTASKRTKNYPECRVCGVSTGSYNRIFCDDHRPPPGKQPLPRKTAICLGCGEEFSRPGSWQGKMNYCSNRCSHVQQKKNRDKFILNLNEHAVVFHSGWEIRFWAACLRFDIPVRSYDGPDIATTQGVYRPDFIVGADETVVDVKGWLRPESELKVAEARAQGLDVMLVDRAALGRFEETGVLEPVEVALASP